MTCKTFSPDQKIVSALLVSVCRFLTGIRAKQNAPLPEGKPCIYYANHSSHLDGLVIWSCLTGAARKRVHPVAAQDYWDKTGFRRYIAKRIFGAVLIARGKKIEPATEDEQQETTPAENPLDVMQSVLDTGDSLILFPEGTRGDGEKIQDFKAGLWHLSRNNPDAVLVPVYLENLNRVLPKGSRLVVPIICTATFGAPVEPAGEEESKADFLVRTRQALEAIHNER